MGWFEHGSAISVFAPSARASGFRTASSQPGSGK
jgi:hypothetical protein